MARKRVKGDCGRKVENECHQDRISQLPDDLVHHIFSFLPTICLVRMSLLSKRWRHMWLSTPFLYFENYCAKTFNKRLRYRGMFLQFVTDCLERRKLCMQIRDTSITSFKCDMSYSFKNTATARQIDYWLSVVVESKVKELDIRFRNYSLPSFVLNASSLTILKLRSLKLVVPSLWTFPSLKVLFLIWVESDVQSVQNLISECPIIEELYLRGDELGKMGFAVSGTLRNLSLLEVKLTDQWLDGLVSGLLLLERLNLASSLKNISIRSHSLKHICFQSLSGIEATLKTANLVCLHFECAPHSIVSVEAPNLLEASLSLGTWYMNEIRYLVLLHLLSNMSFLKKMTLTISMEEILIFPEIIRKEYPSPLPNLKHLKLRIHTNMKTKNAELQDSVLWCAPSLETFEIVNWLPPMMYFVY